MHQYGEVERFSHRGLTLVLWLDENGYRVTWTDPLSEDSPKSLGYFFTYSEAIYKARQFVDDQCEAEVDLAWGEFAKRGGRKAA